MIRRPSASGSVSGSSSVFIMAKGKPQTERGEPTFKLTGVTRCGLRPWRWVRAS
jgi:hypothetical protein